jgi:TPR repeat protein
MTDSRNLEKRTAAERLLKNAVNKGDATALVDLGSLAMQRADLKAAENYYRRAAATGAEEAPIPEEPFAEWAWTEINAEFCTGVAFAKAKGVSSLAKPVRNLDGFPSFVWFGDIPDELLPTIALLAEGGHVGALIEMGWFALNDGDDEARRLWTQAARAGNSRAMHNLGFLARQAGDLEVARKWYEKALKNGMTDAEDALAELDSETGGRGG